MEALGHTCVELRDSVFALRAAAERVHDTAYSELPFDKKVNRNNIVDFIGRLVRNTSTNVEVFADVVRTAHTVFEIGPRSSDSRSDTGSFERELKLLAISMLMVGGGATANVEGAVRKKIYTREFCNNLVYFIGRADEYGDVSESMMAKIKYITRLCSTQNK